MSTNNVCFHFRVLIDISCCFSHSKNKNLFKLKLMIIFVDSTTWFFSYFIILKVPYLYVCCFFSNSISLFPAATGKQRPRNFILEKISKNFHKQRCPKRCKTRCLFECLRRHKCSVLKQSSTFAMKLRT